MEEKPPTIAAKRLWHIVNIVFYMLRKGLSKHKIMIDLHHMVKKGKLAGKAIGNLMSDHYSDLSCRSGGVSVVPYAPGEYEFSCSNTPAYSFPFQQNNRKHHYSNHHRRHHNHHNNYLSCMYPQSSDDQFSATSFQKAFEILNSGLSGKDVSTGTFYGLSPMASPYPLRVTDSPFPLVNEDDDDHIIDKQAEEFIERFHEQLRSQRRAATIEARYQDMFMRGTG